MMGYDLICGNICDAQVLAIVFGGVGMGAGWQGSLAR